MVVTHKFLCRFSESHGLSSRDRGKKVQSTHGFILAFQLLRIKRQIKKVLRYLVKALLEPAGRQKPTNLMPHHNVPGDFNYYYVMITIWYVKKNFPDWKWKWKRSIQDWEKQGGYLFRSNCLPLDNWTFDRADTDKVQLLQWYHYGSILKLCEQGILPKKIWAI